MEGPGLDLMTMMALAAAMDNGRKSRQHYTIRERQKQSARRKNRVKNKIAKASRRKNRGKK